MLKDKNYNFDTTNALERTGNDYRRGHQETDAFEADANVQYLNYSKVKWVNTFINLILYS